METGKPLTPPAQPLMGFGYLIRHLLLAILFLIAGYLPAHAQDGFTGDGFGGRSWYKPANIEAGYNADAAIINGQLYQWGISTNGPFIAPYTTVNSAGTSGPTYVEPQAVAGFANTRMVSLAFQGGAIKADGSGWVWGGTAFQGMPSAVRNNSTGAFTPTFGSTPIKVIPSGASHVSAADSHVAFVKSDGTVWSVGWNVYGNFGTGTANNTLTTSSTSFTNAVQMPGITNARRVAAFGISSDKPPGQTIGYYSGTLVLKADGTVWVAGAGGILTNTNPNYSVTQIPGLTNVVNIRAGLNFAMALTTAGDVYEWGQKSLGQFGNGDPVGAAGIYDTPQKVQFPAGTPPMVAIETDPYNIASFAIDETGTLWGWGAADNNGGTGLLGVGTAVTQPYPVVCARHVADLSGNPYSATFLTRNADYPADQRIWYTASSGSSGGVKIFILNKKEYTPSTLNYSQSANQQVWTICRPEDSGLTDLGIINPTTTIVGTVDCGATAIVGSLVAGTPSSVMLKVTATVSTTGTGTFTVSGSGLSPSPAPGTFTATATGPQTFYIPMAYDGSALGATTFTFGGIGACTADLSGLTKRPVLTPITPLVNCTPFTSVTISK